SHGPHHPQLQGIEMLASITELNATNSNVATLCTKLRVSSLDTLNAATTKSPIKMTHPALVRAKTTQRSHGRIRRNAGPTRTAITSALMVIRQSQGNREKARLLQPPESPWFP